MKMAKFVQNCSKTGTGANDGLFGNYSSVHKPYQCDEDEYLLLGCTCVCIL